MMKQLFRQVLCSLFRNVFLMIAKLFSKSCFYTKISYRKELHTVAPWFQHTVVQLKVTGTLECTITINLLRR